MRLKIAIAVLVLFTCVAVFCTNVSSEIEAAVNSTNISAIFASESIAKFNKVTEQLNSYASQNEITIEDIAKAALSIPDPVKEKSEEVEIEEDISEEVPEVSKESEESEQEIVYNDYIMTIASVVEAETKGQDMESKIHIVHVIRNRVNSSSFPNDYYSVCTAGNQFASRWDIEQSTIDAVNQGLAMEDTTGGALFFCLCKETCWLNGTSYQYLFTDSAGHHFWG